MDHLTPSKQKAPSRSATGLEVSNKLIAAINQLLMINQTLEW